jgi:hypothetical protein
MWWRARQLGELICPLSARSACAQPPILVAALRVSALLCPLFDRLGWDQLDPVVASTTCEGAALASVRLDGVGSDSHCIGGHDKRVCCFWPLFAQWAWAQPDTVLVGTTIEGADLASVRSVGVGSARHCDSGHDWLVRCSGLLVDEG